MLKSLIILADKRLVEYEAEIFADKELTKLYLEVLCKPYPWYDEGDAVPCMIFCYSQSVLRKKWGVANEVMYLYDGYWVDMFWELPS